MTCAGLPYHAKLLLLLLVLHLNQSCRPTLCLLGRTGVGQAMVLYCAGYLRAQKQNAGKAVLRFVNADVAG